MTTSPKPASVEEVSTAILVSNHGTERQYSNEAPLPAEARAANASGPTAPDTMTYAADLENDPHPEPVVSFSLTRRLYISHFLSTWNSRSFEFATVLFLASIFPQTLLQMSIYALLRSASAILLAVPIGHAIDRMSRLRVVRFSIVAGRVSVILSCIGFWALSHFTGISSLAKWALFFVLALLSCIEKPCSVLNLVSIERDWVVEITMQDERSLQNLNARMRRIDLFCKLAGPLFIALIDGASTKVAIFLTMATNIVSVPTEYFAIAQVYYALPQLQASKIPLAPNTEAQDVPSAPRRSSCIMLSWLLSPFKDVKYYYRHSAFLPSFSLALLYFTVLSLGGQMVTYLVSAGYNAFYVGLVRTLSVGFELSATWIAPRVMRRIGPVRSGMWFLSWQIFWLGAAVSFFWAEKRPLVSASGLVAGTILSRIGLWGYDLSAQIIIQQEVGGDRRGSFSSTEASLQNLFELLSYVTTIIWSRPRQFRYPVLLSAVAVYMAAGLFGVFLRQRRGHLVHFPACCK